MKMKLPESQISLGLRKFWAFLGGSLVKNPRAVQELGFDPWIRKIPWGKAWQPTPVFLPEKPLDRRAWWATVLRVARSWT